MNTAYMCVCSYLLACVFPAAEPNQNRENILFDALTNFMRNSALSQMGEIVG